VAVIVQFLGCQELPENARRWIIDTFTSYLKTSAIWWESRYGLTIYVRIYQRFNLAFWGWPKVCVKLSCGNGYFCEIKTSEYPSLHEDLQHSAYTREGFDFIHTSGMLSREVLVTVNLQMKC
jgi:hypothetical protein